MNSLTSTTADAPVTDAPSVRAFIERNCAGSVAYFGTGKHALQVGLRHLSGGSARRSGNVVVPSYVPNGVVGAIEHGGYEARFHRITRSLEPDLDDVEAVVDDDTVAVMTVDYFGFPQPAHGAMVDLARRHEVPLIEDNAHATLSMTTDGRLLGTRGDAGFTSFHKSLPVRNGAALYLNEGGPSLHSRIRNRYTLSDGLFYLTHLLKAGGLAGPMRSVLHAVRDGEEADAASTDPRRLYERAEHPMSRLSAYRLGRLDPAAVVRARRRAYRRLALSLAETDGVEPVFGDLPERVCPQVFPFVVEDRADIEHRFGGRSPWPPLPLAVRRDDRFETAQYLAEHLLRWPL